MSHNTEEMVLYTVEGSRATLTLNRPQKYNALCRPMAKPILKAIASAEQDPLIRVLVITGTGKAFCAGQDLSEPGVVPSPETPADLARQMDALYTPVFQALAGCSIPVVAQVNGIAAGAGMALALWADFVWMHPKAEFHPAFNKVGLSPDSGLTFLLPRLVGARRAREILMLGEKITAEQALVWGLITGVKDDLEAAVDTTVKQLASQAPGALRAVKNLLHQGSAIANSLQNERHWQASRGRSFNYQEGVNAFLEKRAPSFEGE